MIKNGKKQNVVPTTRKMNLAAAMCCPTYAAACLKFRALQYANDMGTTGEDFDALEAFYIDKMGLAAYIKEGF